MTEFVDDVSADMHFDDWYIDDSREVDGEDVSFCLEVSGPSDVEESSLSDSAEVGGDTVSVCVDIVSADSDVDE